MSAGDRLRVHYDERCELCRRSRRWVETRDERSAVEFVPLAPSGAVDGAPQRAVAGADLVVEAQHAPPQVGFDGWLAILGRLPRWRHLTPVLSLPPLRWIGAAVYRLVARHRHRFLRRRGR